MNKKNTTSWREAAIYCLLLLMAGLLLFSLLPDRSFPQWYLSFTSEKYRGDIILHATCFAFLAFVLFWITTQSIDNVKAYLIPCILLTLFSATIELSQSALSLSRQASWSDMAGNTFGIVLGMLAFKIFQLMSGRKNR
jgi:hypothetical protein